MGAPAKLKTLRTNDQVAWVKRERPAATAGLFLYGLDPKNNSMHRRFIEGCVRRLLKQAKGNPVCAETARILEESFK